MGSTYIDLIATDNFHNHYSDAESRLSTAGEELTSMLSQVTTESFYITDWSDVLNVDINPCLCNACKLEDRAKVAENQLEKGNGPIPYDNSDWWVVLGHCNDDDTDAAVGWGYTGTAGLNIDGGENSTKGHIGFVDYQEHPESIHQVIAHETGHGFTACHENSEVWSDDTFSNMTSGSYPSNCGDNGEPYNPSNSYSSCSGDKINIRMKEINDGSSFGERDCGEHSQLICIDFGLQ